jgi:hypothetical protein
MGDDVTREEAIIKLDKMSLDGFRPGNSLLVDQLEALGLLKLDEVPPARILLVPVAPQANRGLSDVMVSENTLIAVLRKAGYGMHKL